MKNNETSKNTALLIKTTIILVLLVVLGINAVIYSNRSFAWFGSNRNTDANGAAVNLAEYGISDAYFAKGVGEVDYTEITDWERIFQNLNPGESISIKAQYANRSDKTHTLRVYLGLIDGSREVPLVKGGKYYYLSTQLIISDTMVNGVSQTGADNPYLMTPPTDKTAYDTEQTVQNKFIAEISLPAGESATVEITVQFVNYSDVSQNDYQGFGAGTENCFRQLIAFIDP